MRRFGLGVSAAALLAAAALVVSALRAPAADAPLAGKWKVNLQLGPQLYTLWLVKIENKGGTPKATLISTGEPNFKDSKIDKFSADGKKVEITFKVDKIRASFPVTIYLSDKGKSSKLLGSTAFRGQRLYAWLEKTDADELDPKKAMVPSPALKELQEAFRMQGDEKKEKAFKDIAKKHAEDPFAQIANMQLLGLLAKKDPVKDEDIKALADKSIAFSSTYGPDMKLQTIGQIAGQLAGSKKTAGLAVTYAREAEKGLAKAGYEQRVGVLTVLATALRNSGKEADAAKIDTTLDREFLKNAVPFKPQKYAGRASKSERVVVLELFTGAQCPPCVAADVAFDAMLARYKPADVVLLQYHLHIPGPDALTNPDSEKRAEYYGVEGTPALYIDGKTGPPAGGGRDAGKASYDEIHKAIDKQLEEDGAATLKLTATRKDDKIDIAADVADLKKTGKDVRLRFVLVEDVVRFIGRNGQRFHHHVVRGFPGGEKGFALEKKSGKQTASVSLKGLTKDLTTYLEKHEFKAKDRPLDLKHLKVVALIQDLKGKEILQAAQVEVGDDK